jgi:hypothetical protein
VEVAGICCMSGDVCVTLQDEAQSQLKAAQGRHEEELGQLRGKLVAFLPLALNRH